MSQIGYGPLNVFFFAEFFRSCLGSRTHFDFRFWKRNSSVATFLLGIVEILRCYAQIFETNVSRVHKSGLLVHVCEHWPHFVCRVFDCWSEPLLLSFFRSRFLISPLSLQFLRRFFSFFGFLFFLTSSLIDSILENSCSADRPVYLQWRAAKLPYCGPRNSQIFQHHFSPSFFLLVVGVFVPGVSAFLASIRRFSCDGGLFHYSFCTQRNASALGPRGHGSCEPQHKGPPTAKTSPLWETRRFRRQK